MTSMEWVSQATGNSKEGRSVLMGASTERSELESRTKTRTRCSERSNRAAWDTL